MDPFESVSMATGCLPTTFLHITSWTSWIFEETMSLEVKNPEQSCFFFGGRGRGEVIPSTSKQVNLNHEFMLELTGESTNRYSDLIDK